MLGDVAEIMKIRAALHLVGLELMVFIFLLRVLTNWLLMKCIEIRLLVRVLDLMVTAPAGS